MILKVNVKMLIVCYIFLIIYFKEKAKREPIESCPISHHINPLGFKTNQETQTAPKKCHNLFSQSPIHPSSQSLPGFPQGNHHLPPRYSGAVAVAVFLYGRPLFQSSNVATFFTRNRTK